MSRKNVSTSSARDSGCATTPPVMTGPTGWRLYSSDAAIPKLPPPPRIAQKRSAFSSALARTTRPSAVTRSAARKLSSARPYLGISQPMPPPSVKPGDPGAADDSAGGREAVHLGLAIELVPQDATLGADGAESATSTWMPFIGDRSISRPSSSVACPATLWPPPRTATVEVERARELHRVDDIGDTMTARDRGRVSVDQAVVDASPAWS